MFTKMKVRIQSFLVDSIILAHSKIRDNIRREEKEKNDRLNLVSMPTISVKSNEVLAETEIRLPDENKPERTQVREMSGDNFLTIDAPKGFKGLPYDRAYDHAYAICGGHLNGGASKKDRMFTIIPIKGDRKNRVNLYKKVS